MTLAMTTTDKMPRIPASPLARRLARESGVDLRSVRGSGPGGRVRRHDLEAFLALRIGSGLGKAQEPTISSIPSIGSEPALGDEATSPKSGYSTSGSHLETVPSLATTPDIDVQPVLLSTFAQQVTLSKSTIPHFYLSIDCAVDRMLEVLEELNRRGAGAGLALTVEDFVLRAAALSMVELPHVNAAWRDDSIKIYRSVDIAVVITGRDGLVTPVIREADRKGLGKISLESRALMAQAEDGSLPPEYCEGGSFAIFSLGSHGIRAFSAIIPAPRTCILAVGSPQRSAVVRNGEIVQATVMSCTLSVDHRIVDGAVAAEFLAVFKRRIEDPLVMLL